MDIRDILNEIEHICKKHNVREVFLFGSYAVGTQTDTSDIDIIVKGVEDIEGLREEIAQIKTLKRIDISWKVMKDIIVKYHKINDFATGSPRETLRIAASVKLIGDDRWMNMLGDRNELTHDYDGTMAKEKVHVIVEEYIPLFEQFREIAEKFC